MKQLRQYIRQILLEGKEEFIKDILDNPKWDQGVEDDIDEYMSQKERYQRARTRGREVKKAFAKHADRNFLDSLVYIHWAFDSDKLLKLIKNSNSLTRRSRDELAAEAYLPGTIEERRGSMGTIGLIVKGHVSLLGNNMDQMVSGYMNPLRKYGVKQAKTSGISRGVQTANAHTYALDRGSFVGGPHSEAFLDNWQPVGIVTLKPGSLKGGTYGQSGINSRGWNEAHKLQKEVLNLYGIELPVYHITDLNTAKL